MNRIELLKHLDAVLGRFLTAVLPSPKLVAFNGCKRVLFIRPGGIGDAVLLVPAIQALQEFYPEAVIDVLAERRNAKVFDLVPVVNRVFTYDRPADFLAVMSAHYDIVVDTEQWHRLSAVFVRFVKAPFKLGYATNERKKLFTHTVEYSHETYEVASFLKLLSVLNPGINTESKKFLTVPDAARESIDKRLAECLSGRFVALFPGASIPERRWGWEKFRALARGLAEINIPVVVVGGQEDHAAGNEIIYGLNGANFAGKTSLAESAAIVERAALLVSGDSGVLHVGVGLGKPTVSLFGSGIAAKWAPFGDSHIVINKNLPCSPCTKFGYTPPCPIGTQCLREITVDEVLNAVMLLIY